MTVPREIHPGFNTLRPDSVDENFDDIYRYIRLYNSVDEGAASCEFAEVNIQGKTYYKVEHTTATDFDCDGKVVINGVEESGTDVVEY